MEEEDKPIDAREARDKQGEVGKHVRVDAREGGGTHAKRECGSSPTQSKRTRARKSRPFQSSSESFASTWGATTKEDPRTSFPTPSGIRCESSIVGNAVDSTKRWQSSRLSRSNLDRLDRTTHVKCPLPRMEKWRVCRLVDPRVATVRKANAECSGWCCGLQSTRILDRSEHEGVRRKGGGHRSACLSR